MSSKYIIRLDDASSYMEFDKWNYIEKILTDLKIKPIVAVIPDNKDKKLKFKNKNNKFWNIVKKWELLGWTIAMHGYQHLYHKVSKTKLLLPFYDRSEFAGLSLDSQYRKIRIAYSLFIKNKIKPNVWIAPGHSFDKITLEAIKKATPIRIVSDGIALNQYYEYGFNWMPQQLWNFKKFRYGLWTVCLHPNNMTFKEINQLKTTLKQNASCFVDFNKIKILYKEKNNFDRFFYFYFWKKKYFIEKILKLRSFLKMILKN